MNGESQLLISDQPIEFEKYPLALEDSGKLPITFRGIYGIGIPYIDKEKPNDHDVQPVGLGNTTLNRIFSV
jgi:hypothetical protein